VIWAEQQLVVIPGWLLQYLNARLVQEGQLTSIKRPRLLITKKNKAKRRNITVRRGGIRWQPKPSSPPPPLKGDFGARTRRFSEKPADLWKKWRI
jgi:hypothetical protein